MELCLPVHVFTSHVINSMFVGREWTHDTWIGISVLLLNKIESKIIHYSSFGKSLVIKLMVLLSSQYYPLPYHHTYCEQTDGYFVFNFHARSRKPFKFKGEWSSTSGALRSSQCALTVFLRHDRKLNETRIYNFTSFRHLLDDWV